MVNKCRDYRDIQQFCPNQVGYVDTLQESFKKYIEQRYDKLNLVSFDKEKPLPSSDLSSTPPPQILKLFTMLTQALIANKAHLQEGVFRLSGNQQLVSKYKEQVRLVGCH